MLRERLLKCHSQIILVVTIMASMIQLCLASISVGRRPNKSFLVQPRNTITNAVLNHVSYSSKSKSNARELSVAAMENSLFATKSKKNQDWRVWCSYQESPQTSIEIFISGFFHAINDHRRLDVENCLAPKCVFEDVIFQIHSGREEIAGFICKLKDALGPHILLKAEVDEVKGITQSSWIATVTWHLEWIDVNTNYNQEGERPRMEIPSTHVTSYFEIGKSNSENSGKLYIRRIFGVLGLDKAVEFKQKLDEARNSLYTSVSDMLQVELLRAASAFYEHFPQQASELLSSQDDGDDNTKKH